MGRDERPRSSASGWAWVERYGNRGWLEPPTPKASFGRDVETHPVNLVHPVSSSSLFGQDLQD